MDKLTGDRPIARRALLIAAALAPVLGACSAVEGRQTAGEYVDDATITTKIKTALIEDPNVKAAQVSVETFNGEVQLSGFVDNSTAKSRAGQLASATKGVKAVKNDLVVR